MAHDTTRNNTAELGLAGRGGDTPPTWFVEQRKAAIFIAAFCS